MKNVILAASVLLIGILLLGCTSSNQQNYTNYTQNYTSNYTQNYTANASVNETKPNITFSITNCTATVYDFGSGSENWAAGLNCSFVTNTPCKDIFKDSILITIFGPDGKKIENDYSVCGNGSKMIRIAPSWTTPDMGSYKIVSENYYGDRKVLDEYNITFSGQKLAVIPVLTLPGSLVADNIIVKGGYHCYDAKLNYVGFKLNNSGDLPAFTDSVSATIDGKSASLSPRFIMLAPGRMTSGSMQLCWSPALTSGIHTLIVKTFSGKNKISEDMINFYVPSLEVVK